MITWGFGLDKQGLNATQAARARCCLRAISGNLDIQGGEPLGWNEPIGKIIGDRDEIHELDPVDFQDNNRLSNMAQDFGSRAATGHTSTHTRQESQGGGSICGRP